MGIRISPYYLVLEGLFNRSLPDLEKGFDEYEIGFLGVEDMKEISVIPGPERLISEEKLLLRLKEGKKCLGIKYRGKIVAFKWFGLVELSSRFYRFPLKEDEACKDQKNCSLQTVQNVRGSNNVGRSLFPGVLPQPVC
ncbi:MAG: hypothetical protein SCARUB_00082 [Candidatus Scalindua rubra]|uniref:Uncharacterized protein n=1 Tax=Candidatus Scalindua rubra TaxID=1872076 RepID=A0A1E3XGT9_9BACT|nr:MAG: hypothetical protein SCARUB_00082 [Candidatus Scalindua rubra]